MAAMASLRCVMCAQVVAMETWNFFDEFCFKLTFLRGILSLHRRGILKLNKFNSRKRLLIFMIKNHRS